MAQHIRDASSGRDSAAHTHIHIHILREIRHAFEDSHECVLGRENRWFKEGVKETIHVKLDNTVF